MSQLLSAQQQHPNFLRHSFRLAPILEDHEKEQDVKLPSFQELDRWLTHSRMRDGLQGFVSRVPLPPAPTPVAPPPPQTPITSYLSSMVNIQVPVSDTYLARAYGSQSLPPPLRGTRDAHNLVLTRLHLMGLPRCHYCASCAEDPRGSSTLPSEIPLSVMDERDGPGVPLDGDGLNEMCIRDWSYPVFSGCAEDYIVVYFYWNDNPTLIYSVEIVTKEPGTGISLSRGELAQTLVYYANEWASWLEPEYSEAPVPDTMSYYMDDQFQFKLQGLVHYRGREYFAVITA